MAQLAFGVAGAALGSFIGQPALGWAIGSYIGGALFAEKQEGPRLSELKVGGSAYGGPIRLTYGTIRVPGDLIFAADLIEVAKDESAKGGPEITTYSYLADFAVMLCVGSIDAVRRIWANGILIYDGTAGNTFTLAPGYFTGGAFSAVYDSLVQSPHPGLRIYLGGESQEPDPMMESYKGAGNVPAYRGRAIIAFNRLALDQFGNRIPQIEAEVVRGTLAYPDPDPIATGGQFVARDPETGLLWSPFAAGFSTDAFVYVVDPFTDTLIKTITLPTTEDEPQRIVYIPATREMWVGSQANQVAGEPAVLVFSCDALEKVAALTLGSLYGAMGIVEYLSDSGLVFVGSNASGVGRGMLLVDPVSRAISFDLGAGACETAIDLPLEGMFAVTKGISGGNQSMEFRSSADGSLIATALVPDSNSIGPPQLAYDDQRRRVIYCQKGVTIGTIYTIDVTDFSVTGHTITPSTIDGANLGALYHKQLDRYFVADATGSGYNVNQLNAETFEVEHNFDVGSNDLGAGYLLEVPDNTDFLIAATAGNSNNELSRIFLQPRVTPGNTTLAAIVTDLCTRSQLVAGDLDVTQLTDLVDGYAVTREMPIRSAIEPLMAVYYFDGVESDGKVKFVKRGGSVAALLELDDLAAHEAGGAIPDALEQTRGDDLELPNQVDLVYLNRALDYSPGAQTARRIVKPSKNITKIEVVIVLDDDKGKQVAEVNLYNAWSERVRFKLAVAQPHAALEPTDVVQVNGQAAVYTLRLVAKRENDNGVIELEGVADDSTAYTQQGVGVSGSYVPQTIKVLAATVLRLLDLPILRDIDDGAGFYLAAGSTSADWKGAQVYRSIDGGANYQALIALTQGATIGAAQSALGDFSGGNIFDELNTVTVNLITGTLDSKTELEVLNGGNVAILGDEVIQFKTATLVSAGIYTLSGLLRGRRGTDWAMSTHALGDRFVLASIDTWRRIETSTAELNLERFYKGVSFGQLVSQAARQAFTDTGRALIPYAGVHIGGGKNGGGDILINWQRRTRIGGEWRDGVDSALGEASESYEVEILDEVGAVARTLAVSSPAATYLAADQASDFSAVWSKIGGDGLNSGWSHASDAEVYVYNVSGTLYACTRNTANASGIWQWTGTAWTQIAGGGINSSPSTSERYVALVEFGGELHCMLINGGNFAECWKYSGGTWSKIGGGSTATNGSWSSTTYFRAAPTAVVFNSKLVVGIGGVSAGAGEVWEWNGTSWTKIGGDGVNSSWSGDQEWTISLCVHNGKLYAGGSFSAGDADVWEYNGTSWTQIGGDGTGWAAATFETCWWLASDGTNLYAALGSSAGDAEVWSYNGSSWTKIGGDGVGSSWSATYESVNSLLCHSNGRIYAGLGDTAGDAELWEYNGSTWSKMGGDAINGSWNGTDFEKVICLAELNGKIYAGLGNSAGDGDLYVIPDPVNPVPNPLDVQIYQLSAAIGRGYQAAGQVRY